MRGQYSLSMESANISQIRTIVPRLCYSNDLLVKIIDVLKYEKSKLKKSNRLLIKDLENEDLAYHKAIDLERTISFCLETLDLVKKNMNSVSKIDEIPKIFPSLVPAIRTISAKLVDIHPQSS